MGKAYKCTVHILPRIYKRKGVKNHLQCASIFTSTLFTTTKTSQKATIATGKLYDVGLALNQNWFNASLLIQFNLFIYSIRVIVLSLDHSE